MKSKVLLALLMLFIIPLAMYSQEAAEVAIEPFPDVDPGTLLSWVSPILVLVGTWLAKFLVPKIPGWGTMIVVTVLSTAITWLNNSGSDVDASWLIETGYGMAAVFLNQFYRQLTAPKE